ncbi:MAG: D-amino-acid oxidase [Mesorhizobium amorphae]|nr:MAG: D-amino-acid oxidase [Mesorhizobium amorphae]
MTQASSARLRLAVVGGGIFGVSTALSAARLGADVMIVTEKAIGSGASSRSLSWLNSARFRSAPYHRLRTAGIDRYRTMFANDPTASWLRFDGGLTWDADGAGNAMDRVHAHERSIGYHSLRLDAAGVAATVPGVDPQAVPSQGAVFNPGEGWVDLPMLIDSLLVEFSALGGKVVENVGEARVTLQNGRVSGLSTASGQSLEADAVLLATGPAVPKMAADLGVTIPDSTPISLLAKTKPVETPLRAVLNTPGIALRPTPDGALVMDSAWSEEEIAGMDRDQVAVSEELLARLLREASNVLIGNPTLALESFAFGPKPIPGDGEPVFGALDTVPGAFVAFSHSGATLGLIAGELIAAEIVSGERNPLLEPFRAARFAGEAERKRA